MIASMRTLALILFCAAFAVAQPTLEKPSDENAEKLEKEAVAFLRETLTDVNGMRSLENRISFSAELAGLMWFHDEREARSMYGGVFADFKDLLTKYDAQMNEFGATPEDRQRGGFMSFTIEPTDKSRVVRRFTTAMAVRQQITMSIAEHDPELAFSFYNDSLSAISNPEFRKDVEREDPYFETRLLSQIAESNPTKAAQLGIASIKKGVTYQHIDLLKKIYAKDSEKGIEFAGAMLSKLKSDKLDTSAGFYVVDNLIRYGEQMLDASKKPGGKPPIYTFGELRDLAELLAQALLNRNGDEDSIGSSYLETIQKYSPGRAAQIRAKFKIPTGMGSSNNSNSNAKRAISNVLYRGDSNSVSNSNVDVEREEREKLEKTTIEDVQKLTTKELPKEEREKVIAQARKIISQTPGRDKRSWDLACSRRRFRRWETRLLRVK